MQFSGHGHAHRHAQYRSQRYGPHRETPVARSQDGCRTAHRRWRRSGLVVAVEERASRTAAFDLATDRGRRRQTRTEEDAHMSLMRLTSELAINPEEVVSMKREHRDYINGSDNYLIIEMKNGKSHR